ncbi:HD domain-containing protein [Phaeobacter gallaeciensis]|uniref:HD domain-containing protein n=1 Tax=Phaeobacter gallaeciensis TaxID=60890 RepID=UPI0023807FEE|nr:HD domain-containing protein [Phaeobacter gallaeciensis]MDE4297179.1 HD domain-containing protein [Phaeobacter gallaeciensis]
MNKDRPLESIYMHTSSGMKYYPFAPQSEHVDAEVIAHHLATRARWNGATQHVNYPDRIFYSVAEHSVYVALYLEAIMRRPDLALMGLLHDASEAYNGDLIRPLKYSAEFAEPFKKVELLNEAAVGKRFQFPAELPPEVKIADEAVCAAELRQIVPKHPSEEWDSGKMHDEERVAPFEIEMLLPFEAKKLFLSHFERLTMHRRVAA